MSHADMELMVFAETHGKQFAAGPSWHLLESQKQVEGCVLAPHPEQILLRLQQSMVGTVLMPVFQYTYACFLNTDF